MLAGFGSGWCLVGDGKIFFSTGCPGTGGKSHIVNRRCGIAVIADIAVIARNRKAKAYR